MIKILGLDLSKSTTDQVANFEKNFGMYMSSLSHEQRRVAKITWLQSVDNGCVVLTCIIEHGI